MHRCRNGGFFEDVVYYFIGFHRNETLVAGDGNQSIVAGWSSRSWIDGHVQGLAIERIWTWLIEHSVQVAWSECYGHGYMSDHVFQTMVPMESKHTLLK